MAGGAYCNAQQHHGVGVPSSAVRSGRYERGSYAACRCGCLRLQRGDVTIDWGIKGGGSNAWEGTDQEQAGLYGI